MKNSIGNSVILTLFGESHGKGIGAVLDGIAPGICVNEDFIASQMQKRKGINSLSTARREDDKVKILSGVFNGTTTGTPITFLIENADQHSKDYSKTKDLARPGHADFTAQCKYHGFQDYRGGGHFSGRITAGIVAAGAICIDALKSKGIYIASHVKNCGGIEDRSFGDILKDLEYLDNADVPVLDEQAKQAIIEKITEMRNEGDSIGGTIETQIIGVPAGVGEPWFDSIEGLIARAMFAIPAVKGIEFGAGFDFANLSGSQANDSFRIDEDNVITTSNNNAGINGGITNGMPISFNVAVKPTPSIYKKQDTIDMAQNINSEIEIQGRHDPAIVHRAVVVVQSMAAIVLCDVLSGRFGTDWLKG